MSIIDKFETLKFSNEPVKPITTATISEEWSRFLSQIELVHPEMHQFFSYLANSRALIKNDSNFAKKIVLDGNDYECLPAITIEINPEKQWLDGAALL